MLTRREMLKRSGLMASCAVIGSPLRRSGLSTLAGRGALGAGLLRTGVGCVSTPAVSVLFRANTHFAVIGDSLTALGFYDDYYAKASAHFGGSFTGTYLNAGVAGNTIQQMDARVNTDIVAASPKPTLVFVASGRNDTGLSPANDTFYYTSLLSKLSAAGITNVLSVSSWLSTEAPDNDNALNDINLREQACAVAAGFLYVDIRTPARAWELINNPTNLASGVLTVDGTHPNATGKLWVTPYLQAAVPYA